MTTGGAPYKQKASLQKTSTNYRSSGIVRAKTNTGERFPRSVLTFGRDHGGVHPTQKPVALCDYLIRTYTEPGAVVLDCTMGSGTTGGAAVSAGRRFVGIERDPTYFETAQQRIADACPTS